MLTLLLFAMACQNSDDVDDTADPGPCVVQPEICDGRDNDCNGIADDDAVDAQSYYWDNDLDGFGAGAQRWACVPPEQTAERAGDCDDKDASVNPDQTEVCDGIDNDCDGEIDPGTAQGAGFYYSDLDQDGYGSGAGFGSCELPAESSEVDGDCDDTDAQVYPGALDTWYDGVDSDCAGNSDYDADSDGSDATEWGGSDCLDQDPSVTGCRPEVSCRHPSASTLQALQPNQSTGLAFDSDCAAWLSGAGTAVSYASITDRASNQTLLAGYASFKQQALARSPLSDQVVFSHFADGDFGLGLLPEGGTSLTDWVRGTFTRSTLWDNDIFNRGSASLAWDSSGCIWVPGIQGDGSLSCVDDLDGSVTEVVGDLAHIEALALDSSEQVYISVGDQVLRVDTSAGSTTLVYTAAADVLSMAFDWNDDLYVSTTASEIELLSVDGSTAGLWQTTSSPARIAISPDGWLMAVQPESQRIEEWELAPY